MVAIDKVKCTGCGMCVKDCVAENIALQDGKAKCGRPCIFCGHCVAVCPVQAVSIPEYDMPDMEACDEGRSGLDIGNLLHAIKARRSIRQYDKTPIERGKLERIVQAGRYTATGANRQGCRFIIAQDDLSALKDIIWGSIKTAGIQPGEASPQMLANLENFVSLRAKGTDYLFRDAPCVLFVAAESAVDAALAAQNMELAAVFQGLGVLYNGFLAYAANRDAAARQWLGLGEKSVQVCMLAGYPRISYKRTAPRKPADAIWK